MADFEVTFTGHWTEQAFSASLSFRTPEDDHPRHLVWPMSLPELQALYRSIDDALQVERNARPADLCARDGHLRGPLVEHVPEGAALLCERCGTECVWAGDTVVPVGESG